MKLVFIGDTHNQHGGVVIPPCDVLVHTGDLTGRGEAHEVIAGLEWLQQQPAARLLYTPGNHDWLFEHQEPYGKELCKQYGVDYLHDSGVVIDGIHFYGTAWTPWFCNWAFNVVHESDIDRHFQKIPDETSILITHGPPRGVLDAVAHDQRHVGCPALLRHVKRVMPRVHAFGHIHEGYGRLDKDGTAFLNCSQVDLRYVLTNRPHVVEL